MYCMIRRYVETEQNHAISLVSSQDSCFLFLSSSSLSLSRLFSSLAYCLSRSSCWYNSRQMEFNDRHC